MICNSYCEHGGICTLEDGHEGLHDSDYCQWDDEHSISEEKADQLILEKGIPGELYLRLFKELEH